MKKLKFTLILLLAALLVSACGTTDQELNPGSGENTGKGEENEDQEKEGESGKEPDGEKEQQENGQGADSENGSDKIRLTEQNLTYQLDKEKKVETAFLKESDNQEYSLYVLPDYELTGEEPRKDILYLKEDDTLFMRIELLPKEANLEEEAETAKLQLESVSTEIKESKPEGHEWLNKAIGLSADNGDDKVSAYLIPREKWLLKLTIFTPANKDAEDPFLKMAETIKEK